MILHNNVKDYFNSTIIQFFSAQGVIHESPCAHIPHQNGVAERKNRHILEVTRSLIFQANTQKYLSEETLFISVNLINLYPYKSSICKVQLIFYKLTALRFHLEIIWNQRYLGVLLYTFNRQKFDLRAIKCIFIGYSTTHKGYKCYHPILHRFYVSHDVIFHEQ